MNFQLGEKTYRDLHFSGQLLRKPFHIHLHIWMWIFFHNDTHLWTKIANGTVRNWWDLRWPTRRTCVAILVFPTGHFRRPSLRVSAPRVTGELRFLNIQNKTENKRVVFVYVIFQHGFPYDEVRIASRSTATATAVDAFAPFRIACDNFMGFGSICNWVDVWTKLKFIET